MTEYQMERRYEILEKCLSDKRDDYSIKLYGSFISITNNATKEGIYTDGLQSAKRWIKKDIRKN